jgi:hypothetical protein
MDLEASHRTGFTTAAAPFRNILAKHYFLGKLKAADKSRIILKINLSERFSP